MTRLATLRRNFPTFRLIAAPFRWLGRSRRRLWTGAMVLLAMIAVPPIWWSTQLLGLPDIGEPFDVQAFQTFTVPDDRNAFVLYRQAAAILKPLSAFEKRTSSQVNLLARWSKASPEMHRFVEENRDALDRYRQAAERPDALDTEIGSKRRGHPTFSAFWSARLMLLLAASRLEEQGDMAGAWDWYRTLLRCLRHLGMHGPASRRMVAQLWNNQLIDRVTTWAADARTTPEMLRRALEDVVACESLRPSETDTLKFEYLDMERRLDDPAVPGRRMPPAWFMSLASRPSARTVLSGLGAFVSPNQMGSIFDAWRVWRREPERSRRVLRLVIANWLAYYERPPADRPKADLSIESSFDIYAFGPEAPAKARVLSPEALSRWLDSTYDAQFLLRQLELRRIQVDEWANHRLLLIVLGTQRYRRDHGTDPPNLEALVGPYLKSLPAELPDDERDQSISYPQNTAQ